MAINKIRAYVMHSGKIPAKYKLHSLFESLPDDAPPLKGIGYVTKVIKQPKQRPYFLKQYSLDRYQYNSFKRLMLTRAYKLEAISSDFYRFILGADRAAKSRVVYDDRQASVFGVASAVNPAGFYSLKDACDDFVKMNFWDNKENPHGRPKDIIRITQEAYQCLTEEEKNDYFQKGIYLFITSGNETADDERMRICEMFLTSGYSYAHFRYFQEHYINVQNGSAELDMAMRVLDEHDAGVHNCGLNKDMEVSRYDYDFTLYDISESNIACRFDTLSYLTVSEVFTQCEKSIAEESDKVKHRFYVCQLRTLLLQNPAKIEEICLRHTSNKKMIPNVIALLNKNISELKSELLSSANFIEFIKTVNVEDEDIKNLTHELTSLIQPQPGRII